MNPITRGIGGRKAATKSAAVMTSMGAGTWPCSCACSQRGMTVVSGVITKGGFEARRDPPTHRTSNHHEGCDGGADNGRNYANVIKLFLQFTTEGIATDKVGNLV